MSRRNVARGRKEEYSDEEEYEESEDDDRVHPVIRSETRVPTWMMARCKELERENK